MFLLFVGLDQHSKAHSNILRHATCISKMKNSYSCYKKFNSKDLRSANLLSVQMNKCGFYVPEQYPNHPNRCVFQYLKLDGSFSND